MATKLYLPATASTTGITPTPDAGWEDTTSITLTRVLVKTSKIANTLTSVSLTDANSVDRDCLFRQYITPLKKGQTITGGQAYSFVCRVSQTTLNNNMFMCAGVRVINQDGTVQKTVLAITRDSNESATALTSRTLDGTTAATNYTTVA